MDWPMNLRSWLAAGGAGLALATSACGPTPDDDDVYPRNCGEIGPVELLDTMWDTEAAIAIGEHVVIWSPTADYSRIDVVAVPRCGGEPVTLRRRHHSS
jgi:hypothetical protein